MKKILLCTTIAMAVMGALFSSAAFSQEILVQQGGAQVLNAALLEDLYGIRITLIGITAAGGMIDFRFKILDQQKAETLLKNAEQMPRLIAEETGTMLPEPMHREMMKHQKLKKDTTYFMLYPNSRDVLKRGAPVSVLIGDLRLEHIAAR